MRKNINVTIPLPQDIISWLERVAASKDMNRSQVVRQILRHHMQVDLLKPANKKGEK